MLQSWLTKIRVRSGKNRSDNPSILSKSVSLRRSKHHPHAEPDPHRLCNSIDALLILSSLSNHQPTSHGEKRRCNSAPCEKPAAHDDARIDNVADLLIQERARGNLDLWDREFSSMSSCGSEDHQHAVSGKRVSGNVCELKRMPRLRPADSICEDGSEDFPRVLDSDSSCSEADSRDVVVNSGCGFEEPWLDSSASSSNCRPEISLHRRHRSASISAVLPPDLQGVVGDSIALVKVSDNPYEDFRESMYQMIMEEDLEKSMDMEELLYCYLSLNSPEHHELIEEVFSDVWSTILMSLR